MENSRDSSVWRSLAVAFGDGLAFGVGMALSQKARREAPLQTENSTVPADRLAELERRLSQLEKTPPRIDPKVLETIVGAFENDLRARDEDWTRRLEAAVEPVQQAIFRQEQADAVNVLPQDVVEDLRALEAQANTLRQEIAEAIPRLVEQRVAAVLAERTGEIEDRLREEARQSAVFAAEQVLVSAEGQGNALRQEIAEAIPGQVEQRVAAVLAERTGEIEDRLREEARQSVLLAVEEALRMRVAERDREIERLREQLAASDRRTTDLLAAIGDACRMAAEKVTPPAPEAEPPDSDSASEGAPRFSTEPPRKWSLPLVSSLLVASGCFAAIHWLLPVT